MPATTEKTSPGYQISRNWESEANSTDPIVWSVDSRQGTLQGPLDFHFLRGKRILLQLDREQIGLLTRAGQLKAVFLTGSHPLNIGCQAGQIHPESTLLFLATDRPLELHWQGDSQLWTGQEPESSLQLPLWGHCFCHIDGPERFFGAFLRHATELGESITTGVIDALVRSALASILTTKVGSSPPTWETWASFLTSLQPADLNPNLAEFGLICRELKVRTSPQAPDAEPLLAGHSTADRVNRG